MYFSNSHYIRPSPSVISVSISLLYSAALESSYNKNTAVTKCKLHSVKSLEGKQLKKSPPYS